MEFEPKGRGYGIAQLVTCAEYIEASMLIGITECAFQML